MRATDDAVLFVTSAVAIIRDARARVRPVAVADSRPPIADQIAARSLESTATPPCRLQPFSRRRFSE